MIYTKTQLILKRYGFTAKKKFGQNFLVDEDILEEIADAADITKDDIVLEIGPGIGSLTQYLADRAKRVVAVEIDKSIIPIIEDFLGVRENVDLINADIMKFDIDAYFDGILGNEIKTAAESAEGRAEHTCQTAEDTDRNACQPDKDAGRNPSEVECLNEDEAGSDGIAANGTGRPHLKVVANLPYYITTPVMMKLIEGRTPFEKMIFMVQREVAERIVAEPGSKNYGALSLAVNYFAKVRVIGTVPPDCFLPQPKVESAVIAFDKYENPPVKVKNEKLMFRLIRASFNQRRKTLANGIANFEGLDIPKEKVREAINACGFDESVRGEKLTLADFAALADELS